MTFCEDLLSAYEAKLTTIALDDLRQTKGDVGDRYFVTADDAPCDNPIHGNNLRCTQIGSMAEFLEWSCAGKKPGWHLFCLRYRDGMLGIGCSGPLAWYRRPMRQTGQLELFGAIAGGSNE